MYRVWCFHLISQPFELRVAPPHRDFSQLWKRRSEFQLGVQYLLRLPWKPACWSSWSSESQWTWSDPLRESLRRPHWSPGSSLRVFLDHDFDEQGQRVVHYFSKFYQDLSLNKIMSDLCSKLSLLYQGDCTPHLEFASVVWSVELSRPSRTLGQKSDPSRKSIIESFGGICNELIE